jgi:hypothetical protein
MYQQLTFELMPGQVPLKLINAITLAPREGIHVTVHLRDGTVPL